MACLQVTIQNGNTIDVFGVDYRIFHIFGLLLNISVVLGLAYVKKPQKPFLFILQALVIYWVVFDMSYNLLSGKGMFYVGTGGIDLLFGYWQYGIKFVLLLTVYFRVGWKLRK